ncbi:hypothetical protein GOP47_0008217, partial [Adiantum capillus-veneris]
LLLSLQTDLSPVSTVRVNMSRYDERSGPTRLYVGHISSRTRTRDLEALFGKYGRVRDVDMKQDFAFVNFSDSRDADEARHFLNGRTFDGSRIVVEFAKRRGGGGGGGGGGGSAFSRDFTSRGPPPGTGRCYNCGHDGHWARDCKAGDWKNRCYRCGERGHIERNCRSSPRRNRSRSRSRSRSPARHRRSRSRSFEDDRSGSPRKDQRNTEQGEQPQRPMKGSRSRSRTPQDREERSRSVSPVGNSHSPSRSRSTSRSPVRPDDLEKSPVKEYQSSSHSGGD